jgi:hypothetical protein
MIKSRRMRRVGHVACMGMGGEGKNACRILVGKSEGKISLGGWIIKMDLREIEWGDVDWIALSQDREQWRALVNMVMNLQVSFNFGKFLSSCTTGSFSRMAQLHGVNKVIIHTQQEATPQ